jgi:hypothetical protein
VSFGDTAHMRLDLASTYRQLQIFTRSQLCCNSCGFMASRCKRCRSSASNGRRRQSSRSSGRWRGSGKQSLPTSWLPGLDESQPSQSTDKLRRCQHVWIARRHLNSICQTSSSRMRWHTACTFHGFAHATGLTPCGGSRKLRQPGDRWTPMLRLQRCAARHNTARLEALTSDT